MEISLNLFSQQFMGFVKEDALMNSQTIEHQLTENVIDYIKNDGFAADPEVVFCENSKCSTGSVDYYKLNAFDYSEFSGILDLFITCYIDNNNLPELTKNRLDQCHNAIVHFLSNSVSSEKFAYEVLETHPDAAEVVETIHNEWKANHINLVRIFIISNGVKKVDYNFAQELTVNKKEIDCEFHLWDIEAVRRSEVAATHENSINIDFANYYDHSIECLEMAECDGVKSYLAIMPAIILAKVFSEHKAHLLNQNVRNYLGGKIKVNKGMAKTLRENPGMFFAYNNGISSTAEEVNVERDGENGRLFITNISNWQIVNGGQTTNTIYSVYKQTPDKLQNVYVTMKVSEIKLESDKENAIATSEIARYANSQTQIKESDLSANIEYMLNLQDESRKQITPATTANKNTRWFFERMRGQYDVAKGDTKTKKGKMFLAENPKGQKFLKTDVAKWEMAWYGQPYAASKGGEQCYDAFYKLKLKDGLIEVDEKYFQHLIAKAIVYRTIAEINKKRNVRAYLNIICNYVLATISMKSHGLLDLDYIWSHQAIQPTLESYIINVSDIVNKHIAIINQKGDNPTVKAKNMNFWNDLKLRMAALPEMDKTLLQVEVAVTLTQKDKQEMAEFEAIPLETWKELSVWAKNVGKSSHKFSLLERKKIDHIAAFLDSGRDVLPHEAINALALYKKAISFGFTE